MGLHDFAAQQAGAAEIRSQARRPARRRTAPVAIAQFKTDPIADEAQ
jgi:hypothetical protein